MLAVISPAKTLDYQSAFLPCQPTQPVLLEQSQQLIDICRQLSPAELGSLMSISDKLAGLNAARFAQWDIAHNATNARPAIYAFKGDVYTGLEAETLTAEDIQFAQSHLRMLSGLYGVLRPLDMMQPYRLEMGTKLANPKGKDLYAFWGNLITHELNQTLNEQNDGILINLASDEYFSAVNPSQLQAKIIKPVFLDYKNGKYKVISFYAKKARGLMCRYMIQQRLTNPEQLKKFDLSGYQFDPNASNTTEYIFKRNQENV